MVVDKEKNVQVSIYFSLSGILSLRQKVYSTASQKYLTLFTHLCFWLQFLTPILVYGCSIDFTFVDLISLSHAQYTLFYTSRSCGRQYHLRSGQTFADSFSHK